MVGTRRNFNFFLEDGFLSETLLLPSLSRTCPSPLSLPFPPFPSPSDHVRPLDFSDAARILPRLWRKNKGIEIGLRPNRIQPGLTNREATRIERRPNRIGLG